MPYIFLYSHFVNFLMKKSIVKLSQECECQVKVNMFVTYSKTFKPTSDYDSETGLSNV